MTLLDRAQKYKEGIATLTAWLGSGAQTVDPELAQARANICLTCPLNVKENRITAAMAAAIKKQLEIKARLRLRVSGEKSLLGCAACGCATRLKIWVPLERILPDPDELKNFDPNCWLLHESSADCQSAVSPAGSRQA